MALPSGTTGSLRPTFVPARPIGLAVKHPYTFTLDARLPTGLRVPLHSSVLIVTPTRFRGPSCYGRVVIGGRAFLPASGRRRPARTVSSSHGLLCEMFGVQSLRISRLLSIFPADCPHSGHCHGPSHQVVSAPRSLRFSDFPAYSRMLASPSPARRATLNMLPFGRRSPQSNCPLSTVPVATNNRLEFKHSKGGVSSLAPYAPKCTVHSLPPTLRMLGLNPIPSCS